MNNQLADFLNKKAEEYNTKAFIEADPICIPHLFSKKQDIEIAGFFAAIFAWGNRKMIIGKCKELMQRMDNSPHEFCLHLNEAGLKRLMGFKHRTFNDTDLLYFVEFLHHHYTKHDTLETALAQWIDPSDVTVENALNGFHRYFFSLPDAPARTQKHIAAPFKNSACKRLNMYLRWMVRRDTCGVDFGLWQRIAPAQLVCPVDVHVARVAKRFQLLTRPQTDWIAALELTENLRKLDKEDPAKYDFALFGLGVIEKY